MADEFKIIKFGFSLIEILVVISVFVVISIVITQAIFTTVRQTKKGDSYTLIKDNLEYALSVMERNIHNAEKIISCTATGIVYEDEYDTLPAPSFSCIDIASGGDPGYIASGSSRLTSQGLDLIGCNFVCITPTPGLPPPIDINLTATPVGVSGIESATVSAKRRILLRSY